MGSITFFVKPVISRIGRLQQGRPSLLDDADHSGAHVGADKQSLCVYRVNRQPDGHMHASSLASSLQLYLIDSSTPAVFEL